MFKYPDLVRGNRSAAIPVHKLISVIIGMVFLAACNQPSETSDATSEAKGPEAVVAKESSPTLVQLDAARVGHYGYGSQ